MNCDWTGASQRCGGIRLRVRRRDGAMLTICKACFTALSGAYGVERLTMEDWGYEVFDKPINLRGIIFEDEI